MQKNNRNFIIFTKHRRLKRLWQFFFTGWGLVMVAALVAGALFSRQLIWTPISAINMADIISNQFKMTNASFSGIDQKGAPFKIRAKSARQEYDAPDTIHLDTVSGTITQDSDGKMITRDISARRGKFNRRDRTITLIGNVRIYSSDGDKIFTEELVIRL